MNNIDEEKSVQISELNSNLEEEPELPPVMEAQEATSPYIQHREQALGHCFGSLKESLENSPDSKLGQGLMADGYNFQPERCATNGNSDASPRMDNG